MTPPPPMPHLLPAAAGEETGETLCAAPVATMATAAPGNPGETDPDGGGAGSLALYATCASWTTRALWVAYHYEHDQAHITRRRPTVALPHRQACRLLARELERREGAGA